MNTSINLNNDSLYQNTSKICNQLIDFNNGNKNIFFTLEQLLKVQKTIFDDRINRPVMLYAQSSLTRRYNIEFKHYFNEYIFPNFCQNQPKLFYVINGNFEMFERTFCLTSKEFYELFKLSPSDLVTMKMFYMKVMGSRDCNSINELEGLNGTRAVHNFIGDLIDFSEKTSKRELLDQIVNELMFTAEQHNFFASGPKGKHTEVVIDHIMARIDGLGKQNEYQNVLLQGGWKSESSDGGHSMLYLIEQDNTERGKFTFRVINSARSDLYFSVEENKLHSQLKTKFIESLKKREHREESHRLGLEYKEKVIDARVFDNVYSDLSIEDLNPNFFETLLQFSANEQKKDFNGREIFSFIDSKLNKKQGSNIKKSKFPHGLQMFKGCCAIKPITIFIKHRLGVSEHRNFKSFSTEKEIKKFEEFRSTVTEEKLVSVFKNKSMLEINTILDKMKETGDYFNVHRKNKVNQK